MVVKVSELNGAEFKVIFRRALVVLDKTQKYGYRFRNLMSFDTQSVVTASIATECRIIAQPSGEICASALVTCDTRDVFDKGEGRRRALAKALDTLPNSPVVLAIGEKVMKSRPTPAEDVPKLSMKKVRTEFWDAYFKNMDKNRRPVKADATA